MPISENTPETDSFPLLIGAQVEAYTLRRQTCDELATLLRDARHLLAASLVEEDRDFTELSRCMAAVPAPAPESQHAAGCRSFGCRCGCARAEDC